MGPVIWSCAGAALEGRQCGTELSWSGAQRAAAYGKPMWDQFKKDGMLGEGPHAHTGAERLQISRDEVLWTDCSHHSPEPPWGRRGRCF